MYNKEMFYGSVTRNQCSQHSVFNVCVEFGQGVEITPWFGRLISGFMTIQPSLGVACPHI